MISFLYPLTMDYLCEPIQVNRKFKKLLEEVILPRYNEILKQLLDELLEEIDEKYLNNEVLN